VLALEFYIVSNAFCSTSPYATGPNSPHGLQLVTKKSNIDLHASSTSIFELEVDNDTGIYDHAKCQAFLAPPLSRKNVIDRLLFSWVRPLMTAGNTKILQVSDLWKLDDEFLMKNASDRFAYHFEKELSTFDHNRSSNNNRGALTEFWTSPVSRAIVKMLG
jgi:hypothetical protein